jgi:hypothetical protein
MLCHVCDEVNIQNRVHVIAVFKIKTQAEDNRYPVTTAPAASKAGKRKVPLDCMDCWRQG